MEVMTKKFPNPTHNDNEEGMKEQRKKKELEIKAFQDIQCLEKKEKKKLEQ